MGLTHALEYADEPRWGYGVQVKRHPDTLMQLERPFFRRSKVELQHFLEARRSFADLVFDGCDSSGTAACFELVFRQPCLRDVVEECLFNSVKRWALESFEGPVTAAPLERGSTFKITAAQCRRILAAALVGNVLDVMAGEKRNKGGMNFSRLVYEVALDGDAVSAHKLAAILLYFESGLALEGSEDDARIVGFERLACPSAESFESLLLSKEAQRSESWGETVLLHAGSMEDPDDATAFVNFANADFGYGRFIPSCTQEEILQMACPEFNVGMLVIGRMDEDEVVNVRRCRRFTTYTGYLDTYRITGRMTDGAPALLQDILTLDACTNNHFSPAKQLRDMRKAYASFSALVEHGGVAASGAAAVSRGDTIVSTGRWGCGVFGGLPAHKFVQQVLAARLAGVRLRFSTFGNTDGCDKALVALEANRPSSAQVYAALLRCTDRKSWEQSFKQSFGRQAREEGREAGWGPPGLTLSLILRPLIFLTRKLGKIEASPITDGNKEHQSD